MSLNSALTYHLSQSFESSQTINCSHVLRNDTDFSYSDITNSFISETSQISQSSQSSVSRQSFESSQTINDSHDINKNLLQTEMSKDKTHSKML